MAFPDGDLDAFLLLTQTDLLIQLLGWCAGFKQQTSI